VANGSKPFEPMLTGDGDNDTRTATPPKFEGEAPRATETAGGDRAALAPDGANRAAGVPNSQTPATTAERIAARTGADDAAPLGDPEAPQGTGREQNTQDPANRPAPAGKIRFAQADSRHEAEHGE
jgi:hypothetical protein